MKSKRRVLCLVLICLVLFSASCSSDETIVGDPTSLDGRDPMALICEIQQKFKQIPKPVFTEVNYYKPWKEWRFAAGTSNWSESYDVILNNQAYAFLREHSAVEINIALLSLIIDPENSADVLALFDGMRPRGKKHSHYGNLPTHIIGKYRELPATKEYLTDYFRYHQGHYRGEAAQKKAFIDSLQWDNKLRLVKLLAQNTFYPGYLPSYQGVKGSLEYEIVAILKSYVEAKTEVFGSYWRYHKDWTTRPTLEIKHTDKFDNILAMQPQYLEIGEHLKKLFATNNRELTALVLLSAADIDTLGILHDLQKKYWLAYTTNWSNSSLISSEKGRRYKQTMYAEIVEKSTFLCSDR